MIRRLTKKHKKSSTNSRGIYSKSPSLKSKIRFFIIPANVRLILTLHNSSLEPQMKDDLDKLLGSGNHLPHDKHELDEHYHRHIWELYVRDGGAFKNRLTKYKRAHPDVNIHAEDINSALLGLHWFVYIMGAIAAAIEIIVNILHWVFHFQ